jgi:hypothetical protein
MRLMNAKVNATFAIISGEIYLVGAYFPFLQPSTKPEKNVITFEGRDKCLGRS